jgi:phosphopantothenate-cysteine ligase
MKNILITGGPVHAHLDSVKIITNNFKGGLIAELAHDLSMNGEIQITYLCSRVSKTPAARPNLKIIYHEGFDDYMAKVLEMTPQMDAVILGAAVANLIPYKAIEGKFPSHNYKPGDLVPLIFKIAPRVIDEVKKVAPKVHLFGFKLLDNVPREELIKAAYGVLLESKATAIIANDRQDLEHKYIVTKERAVHPVSHDKLAEWIWDMINDEYYTTSIHAIEADPDKGIINPYPEELEKLKEFNKLWPHRWGGFLETPEGYVFGTLAKRCENNSFWTTGRGKREEDSYVFVSDVNHVEKRIHTLGDKATLNAPLLSHIFETMPEVDFITHSHNMTMGHKIRDLIEDFPVLPYAPPGTVRDSIRDIKGSFCIENHGSFCLFDKEGNLIPWTIK